MGRVGDNETHNSAVHETIDHSSPENVPRSRAPPPRSQAPSGNEPQSNRPHEEEEDLCDISSQDQRPVSFPPQNNEYELPNQQVHAFPQANMAHFAQPTAPPQYGVQMVYPVAAPPAPPLNVISGVAAFQVYQDKPWNSGLFDCMNDPENALITVCCPCITFGQIAEILDYGSTSCGTSGMLYSLIACCIAIPCIMSCTYRTKLRAKFGLIESPAPDWVVHCFCEWCALCQEYRQLKDMGYDPSIGWLGNEARMRQRQNQQFGMTPPTGQMMIM